LGDFDFGELWALNGVRENDWIKLLGWPGYRVNRHEIDEPGKILKLWARRKGGNRKVMCSGCGRKMTEACNVYQREVRDLPRSEYRATVLIELYRVRCPDCGVKNGENSAVAQQGTVQPAL